MTPDEMILVSVDDHVVEPPSMADFMRDHMPAKYKERAPRVIRRENGTDAWLIEGKEITTFGLNAVMGRVPEEWGYDPGSFDQVRPGTYDVHERIRDMNANGVLAGMNFSSWPGLGGQYFVQSGDLELAGAIHRAYNDWTIHEWAASYPGRFIPLALSGCALGPDWMAAEIRRVAELGCHAISMHSTPHVFGMPDFHGDEWDPAWQACQDTNSAMVFHFGGILQRMPRSPFDVIPHSMPFSSATFASELLWSPVIRKFPDVKIALAETGIGWFAYWLEKADFVYRHHHRWTGMDFGGKLPSEAFKDRVLVCFIEDTTGLKLRHDTGVHNIAWECDFPHSDSTWPNSPEGLWESLQTAGVPDDEIHMITWQNAARFYEFDPFQSVAKEQATVGALRALATNVDTTPRRYGPPPDETALATARTTAHFAPPSSSP
jgi:predicted TIM-barrel fold metal-dependent hydrolase